MGPGSVRLMPEEWITEDFSKSRMFESHSYRAVLCLEHLIKNNYNGNPINVVEVGPIPTFEWKEEVRAPIAILKERNPKINCISIGSRDVTVKRKKQILGDIQYVKGIISTEDCFQKYIEEMLQRLGGIPDIFYGQHVFEDSESSPESLPVGPYKPFEKCAEVLKDGGFIVVDNYGGTKEQIGRESHRENSKKMKLSHSYIHTIDEPTGILKFYCDSPIERGIYAFRKTS